MDNRRTKEHAMTMAGLNLIQQALTIYDSDLKLVITNNRFREMFHLPEKYSTPGADFGETIHYLAARGDYGALDDVAVFVQDRISLARTFEPHYFERETKNGRWLSVEGSPLPDGGWVTVYTDITNTKSQERLLRTRSEELSDQMLSHAEELSATNRKLAATVTALEEAKRQLMIIEARTRLTAEMMPAHIAHVDHDRLYTYSNRRLNSVMPGRPDNILGLHIRAALGDAAYVYIGPQLDIAFTGKSPVFEFDDEHSSRRIRVAFTPDIVDGEIDGVYILSMDITEEAQTRAALQQTRRREIAAQMISGLAHDFSNLLTIILGAQSRLERIAMPDQTGEQAGELINATLSAARRGGALLNRIADMTNARAVHPSPTRIVEFLNDFEVLAGPALPPGIPLIIHNTVTQDTLMLDAGMLQDSLLNLVLNARDACNARENGHGEITLTARTIKDTWVEFIISDTGMGFSKHALERAFEPFFTTKGGEGSGLGLAMVYDMTKLAGGRVRAANTHNGGQVSLRLPLRVALPPAAPGLVLLVEDSPDLRASVRDMLTEFGHTVIEAASVDEALALAGEIPDISMVLSDISLEGTATGIDLFDHLKDARPATYLPRNLPCYLMTSLAPKHPLFEQAINRAPVLPKPFSSRQLAAFLQMEPIS